MRKVNLVRLDPAVEKTIHDDPAYLDAMIAENWASVADIILEKIGRTTTQSPPVSMNELAWSGYFTVDADTQEFVGSCAFKGEPNTDATVEIAYFTYPAFEAMGYATAMAGKLIEMAGSSGDVRRVIAHTLPESNPSTRVLEKIGMTLVGTVTDPEDGEVWQWQLEEIEA